ncbi:nucleolar protein 10 [Schistocerca piceifrons]|uniref:nucleolar protein 10 n=1 Tax=Schistocerca piceifrons TaxID=274613 RepID=UPI001F5E35CE|nr:nucleolar protein 10 [Schistocerca piceifrons]
MQVSNPNNVKIYNLSVGKSLPDWLSERKRRALQKKHVDIRRRIELIQDFEMPGLSTSVRLSKDGNYILATGIYKPRVRCFDVNNLSMKFERCFDSEVVTFEILSEDYSKVVFLQCDRYIEFHAAHGRYYRLRIPKFGRDMKYHYPSCDLYVVGASSEIYRLNLEQGQFLPPLVSEASEINKCAINPVHHLVVCGSKEGKLEAWDPRTRGKVGTLDCALDCAGESQLDGFPSITAINFHGGLTVGVGTATGQVLLYDIRSDKPFCVKDHMYGLPILDVHFHEKQDLVLSMDRSIVKIWDKTSGKLFTSIEAAVDFNNLCLVPNSGMMFVANEGVKIQAYYIPSMGPAPKWCGFLDSLTEELEENQSETVYDDYKFVTRKELEELGLDHLMGTNLLRAYMHGFFVDIRLYRKAKSVAEPFAFEQYKKKRIREKIEEERANRVKLQKLPKVNKDLALKLMDEETNVKKKKNTGTNLLKDERFKALFENPDFEVDKNAEEYRLLNPVVSRLDKARKKELKKQILTQQFEQIDDEPEGRPSSDEQSDDESSSDDDREWTKELKRQHRLLRREARQEVVEEEEKSSNEATSKPKFFEIREGEEFKGINAASYQKKNRATLGERLQKESKSSVRILGASGSREMTFTIRKNDKYSKMKKQAELHKEERRKLSRPARGLRTKGKSKFWMGRRTL